MDRLVAHKPCAACSAPGPHRRSVCALAKARDAGIAAGPFLESANQFEDASEFEDNYRIVHAPDARCGNPAPHPRSNCGRFIGPENIQPQAPTITRADISAALDRRMLAGMAALGTGDSDATRQYCGAYLLVRHTPTGRLYRFDGDAYVFEQWVGRGDYQLFTQQHSAAANKLRLRAFQDVYDQDGFLKPEYWSLPRITPGSVTGRWEGGKRAPGSEPGGL